MKEYNSIELRDVVQRLVGGYITPVGNTQYDNEAYKRQKTIQNLINLLIGDIVAVADCAGSQSSIEKARNQAVKWMNREKDYLEDYLEDILENVIEDNEEGEEE